MVVRLISKQIKSCFPKTWFQYYITISATICMIIGGLEYGWPSPSIPKLLDGSHIRMTSDETAILAVIPLLSSIIGDLIAGVVLDKIGRKKGLILLAFPYFFVWILIAFGTKVELLYVARFTSGVFSGFAFTVVPMYLGEISDAHVRGLLGSLPSVGLILGVLIINIIGQYLSIASTAIICSGFPIVFLLMISIVPESPYYLIMKEQYEEAKQSLRLLKGVEDVDDEFVRLTKAIQDDHIKQTQVTDIFTVPSNRKTLLVICGLRTVQQLSGITAITFYTSQILKIDHIVVIYFSIQFVMTCFSSVIMDFAGRRPLLLVSSVGTGLASMLAGIYFYWLDHSDITTFNDVKNNDYLDYIPVIAMIGYIVMYSIGLCTIPLMMTGEIFPTNVKAFAIGLSDIYFCLIASVAAQFFHVVEKSNVMFIGFFGFAIFSFVGAVFIFFLVPETKGKTLEEVVEHFRGSRKTTDKALA